MILVSPFVNNHRRLSIIIVVVVDHRRCCSKSSLLSIIIVVVNHRRCCQSSSLLSIVIVVVLSVERRLVLSAQDNVQLREEVAAALEQLRHRSVGMVVVVVVPLPFFIVVENVCLLLFEKF
jgi:hypothetical protein